MCNQTIQATQKAIMIIYHADCADGLTAAVVAARAKETSLKASKPEFVAAQYGDEPPDVTGKDVVIVDFSYPRETLLRMRDKASSLLVFDHHKTAEAELKDLDFCVFDNTRSGAAITWDLTHDRERPDLVRYVQDRDLWRWELPFSKEINAYIACQAQTVGRFQNLLCERLLDDNVIQFGKGALASVASYVESVAKNARRVDFAGWPGVLVVNAPAFAISDVLSHLADPPGVPFAVGWWQRADKLFSYSLRSNDRGTDVSSVAKRFGGGGHRNAAGFLSGFRLFELPSWSWDDCVVKTVSGL